MIDVRWRKALQAYFGVKGFDKIIIVLLKALTQKRKPCRCIRPAPSTTYPVYVGYAADTYFFPSRSMTILTGVSLNSRFI
jgi:hypothetical protein